MTIKDALIKTKLVFTNNWRQTYDGAATTSGIMAWVQASMKVERRALFNNGHLIQRDTKQEKRRQSSSEGDCQNVRQLCSTRRKLKTNAMACDIAELF